jgi:transcriptional regulator with GAF, ATPase, and Fis domain/serine/threonine protein kinase
VVHGRYRLDSPLGEGGGGAAVLAWDLARRRPVTLKFLHATGQEQRRAFQREFALLRGLFHPRLQRVHDFGSVRWGGASLPYYVSAHIDGPTLSEFAGSAQPPQIVSVLVDALHALAVVHRAGFLHGDIKPQNILVDADGRGTLIDFGCARSLGSAATELWGTPGWIAPEVLEGFPADGRADLYAVGKVLETLLDGRMPPRLVPLARRLTAREPERRPADVREVLETLGERTLPALQPLAFAPRLVGRRRELQRYEQALDALRLQRRGVRSLWVVGAPGMGKSRLLEEMKWRAQERGPVVEAVLDEPNPLRSLLERASDQRLPADLDGVLAFTAQARERGEMCVLVVDDADRLPPHDQELLLSLERLLDSEGPVLLLCSACSLPPQRESREGSLLELAPLSGEELLEWVPPDAEQASLRQGRASFGPSTRPAPRGAEPLADLLRKTGGIPAEITWWLHSRAAEERYAQPHSADTAAPDAELPWLDALPRDAREVLACLLALDGELPFEPWAGVLGERPLAELAARGLVVSEGDRLRLSRPSQWARMRAALGEPALTEAYQRLLHAFQELPIARRGSPGASFALQSRLAAGAGRLEFAAQLLEGRAENAADEHRPWTLTARLLSATFERQPLDTAGRAYPALAPPEAAVGRFGARLAALWHGLGRPDEALRVAARALRSAPALRTDAELNASVAQGALALGQHRRAQRYLSRALQGTLGAARRRDLVLQKGRCLVLTGEYAEARELAESVTQGDCSAHQRALAAELLGVCASYQGRPELARTHYEVAEEAQRTPRDRVRFLSYRAINEFRAGAAEAALPLYQKALEIAEHHHLPDLVASAALNWGTVCQQLGRWGEALTSYERALEVARALGKTATVATLEFNLANLFSGLGCFERASEILDRAEDHAPAHLKQVALSRAILRAEICVAQGLEGVALEHLERAETLAAELHALREFIEVEQHRAEIRLRSADRASAEAHFAKAEALLGTEDARDLRVRQGLLGARLALVSGQAEAALQILERCWDDGERAGSLALEAELLSAQAHALRALGRTARAQEHEERAESLWRKIASGLTPEYEQAFWRHPSRRRRPAEAAPAPGVAPPDELAERLTHFLAVNRRLNSALSVEEVLRCTMDAAIELTGAERGFVLLAENGGLRVAVLRNMTAGENEVTSPSAAAAEHEESHAFSRSIAERVLQTQEPVLTLDAMLDQRFSSQKSVHAMRLKAVACVPIVSPDGVLGALYLDNRYRPRGFGERHTELLLAFADQAAIALRNARLLAALETRTRELEEEKRRVERLSRGQALEIERLAQEVATKQHALETRHDYGSLVGRGSAMQQMLRRLDRIIDTDVSVLIQGESGTGKELVARAIHFNGPRKRAPFLGINCGALPENLLEAELFGAVRGAFTGADRDRTGLLVEAKDGTVFLDEIGDLPLALQVKLLRVLQEREVRPLGSSKAIRLQARFLFATHRDLRREVAEGRFREDLFFRIGVVDVTLPPLRERLEDLAPLADAILERRAREMKRPPPKLSPGALAVLAGHTWPGNVRELENVLTRAFILNEGSVLTENALLADGSLGPARTSGPHPPRPRTTEPQRSRRQFERDEAAQLFEALTARRWNVSEVARALRIPRNTLYRKLKKYGLEREPS